ncbi:cupin domain-containing protein [Verminephrobacter aporrectodeae]|uniref:cupin domain-containing protein n=1 Tax=Verminephrobacter aporrectodeae TaxID=1110389 RepID=UPI00223709A5|nr:cupin domain-containing protein [Verminephrobacter aporrectodeae]MCW5220399.1 cupin domain-containing protein [Verminephrobacter aporrectodeae subsp. tuberculatae]MCW5289695.1 cupin domain-containing protein [Verminephrobacter aporrectodeae subsp. tuberculatae]MCW8176342.1 cupin domain-containing protein [Verminephrobacter aporrectodeae subsp. tuberculatae]MCW8200549.1 cupin domain-containing protein [Verminephrobacter aporrectodeae subsp. tuberculatae]MCW8204021.1 cupin domain-containing p
MSGADLRAHDVHAALAGLVAGTVSNADEDAAAFPRLAAFNQGAVYVGRFSGASPWECHPDADELLYVLDGEVEVTLLSGPKPVLTLARAGCVLVVPRGVWHRQWAAHSVTLLTVTPDRSEISFEVDPRTDPGICATDLRAHDVHAALAGLVAGTVSNADEDAAAFPRLATFNQGAVYVGRFSGVSPWECHPDADELLYVLDGEVEVTLLSGPKPVLTLARAGCVLVVPRGVWHRQWAARSVTLLAVTPDRSEISFEADPRTDPGICATAKEGDQP